MTEDLPQVGGTSLEDLKQINQHGAEYWSARDLQSLLGYTQWRSFEKAIQKAVTSCEFHDAGYKGLYGGLGAEAIKHRKGIPEKDQLMDRMDTTELAANQFRMTQTRDKLARERVRDQEHAIQTHKQVGHEVREAIKRIGGTLPENLPPAEHIKQVEKRIKHATPRLELDGPDAHGLIGQDVGAETGADGDEPHGGDDAED